LREGLAATFDRIPGLEGVDVRVEAGVVFLSGTVLSSGDQALADSLATQTPGVLYVDDRIAEETSVSMRLRPLLQTAEGKLYLWLSYLPLLLLAVALALFFLGLARLVYRWDALFDRVSRNPFLRNLIRQIVGGSVGLLGVLLALELLDATALVGAVLGAAGVVGIAMGFAFRNIAENYLAGIILSLRQPFSPDDHVLVEGQEGRVLRLTSRETLLMTLDGNHLRIPNATIFNSVVQNLTRNPLRRFRFDLSVGQSEDLSRVMELARATLLDMEGVLNDPPPWAIVSEVGDSWVLLRFFGWVDQRDVAFEKARSEAIRLTKEAFDAAGIAMPAPEYGLRLLDAEPGVKIEVEVPTAQAGPVVETDRIDQPPESPVPIQVDLGPDRALDEQIARDREEAKDRDLLEPTN
ncbi:MAG: mechanosensitive ion channel, partial [Gemmatimonadetes bacterium]|nr:mechanosensitive ion channel [Gemmatimonadota bacterium]